MDEMKRHVVCAGDTLWRIAQAHHVTLDSIYMHNPAVANQPYIFPGQVLYIMPSNKRHYIVQAGDTISKIASLFHIHPLEIKQTNKQLLDRECNIGEEIIIPHCVHESVMHIHTEYGYDDMKKHIHQMTAQYAFIQTGTIGQSVLGKPIHYLKIGDGSKRIHVNAAIHANEWITTAAIMQFINTYAEAINSGNILHGICAQMMKQQTTLYVVPMVNPDGVDLVQQGITVSHPYQDQLIQWNNGRCDFKNWKANIRGVDLNDQFPAYWEKEKERRNKTGPGPSNYSGDTPLCEPEAKALAEWTVEHQFDSVVSLHSQGREIYWNYRDSEPLESYAWATHMASSCGYRSVKLNDSDAGYKDWFIHQFQKPGFTVEVGAGQNPLPIQQLPNIHVELSQLMCTLLNLVVADE